MIPFIYLRGTIVTLDPVSMIKVNLVAPSRAATSKSGGSAGAVATTRRSSFPTEWERRA